MKVPCYAEQLTRNMVNVVTSNQSVRLITLILCIDVPGIQIVQQWKRGRKTSWKYRG